MAKRPTSVKILGLKFKIEYSLDTAGDLYGETDGSKRIIKIQPTLSDKEFSDTLLHEILHAILFISGHCFDLSDGREEALVRALEHGLSSIVVHKI